MLRVSRSSLLCLALSLTFLLLFCSPSHAEKPASSQNVKIGYFNLNKIKVADPQVAASEQLKLQAEAQLKNDLDEGNKKVQKMKDEKKPEEEIKKTVEHIQTEINAKMQALAQLVQNNNAAAQEKLRQVISIVAKENALDIVVDAGGVYAGGQRINDNGVDITDDVLKKLNSAGSEKPAAK